MSYGHGISVSLLQLAHAYTIFARDGVLVPLTLVRTGNRLHGARVISTRTAREVRAMLELAVQPGGTGPRARIVGWQVAGKTGTAQSRKTAATHRTNTSRRSWASRRRRSRACSSRS